MSYMCHIQSYKPLKKLLDFNKLETKMYVSI